MTDLTFDVIIPLHHRRMPHRKLEQLLLSARVLDPADLANGVARADQAGTRVAWSLIDAGVIDERVFARIVSEGTETALVERLPEDVDRQVYRKIPTSVARQYRVVPIHLDDQKLTVAMIDPTDADAIEVLEAASGLEILPVVALKTSLERLLEHVYPFDIDVDATHVRQAPAEAEEQSVETNPALEPKAPSPASSLNPDAIEKRLELIEKQLDEISTIAAQARLALNQIRKKK